MVAFDNAGGLCYYEISVTIDNTAPKAEIIAPKEGAILNNIACPLVPKVSSSQLNILLGAHIYDSSTKIL